MAIEVEMMRNLLGLPDRLVRVARRSRRIYRNLLVALFVVLAFLATWALTSPEMGRFYLLLPGRISSHESGTPFSRGTDSAIHGQAGEIGSRRNHTLRELHP